MEFGELMEQCHETAVSKGFDIANQNMGEILMLVVCELSEAVEADRNNKYANMKGNFNGYIDRGTDAGFKQFFTNNIKDTHEDEIADAVIDVS